MKNRTFIFIAILTLALVGCADVTPVEACLPGDPYGFWGGLWHGMIAPISFWGSIFSNDIAMYAVNNNGGWYDFGFITGIGGWGMSKVTINTKK